MKFEIGDKVVRIASDHGGMFKGDIGTVIGPGAGIGSVRLKEYGGTHSIENLKLHRKADSLESALEIIVAEIKSGKEFN